MCLLSLPTAPSSHMVGGTAIGYMVSALCGLPPLPDVLAGPQPLTGYLFSFWDWTLNLCLDSHPVWILCYNPLPSAWWVAAGHLPPLLMVLFTSDLALPGQFSVLWRVLVLTMTGPEEERVKRCHSGSKSACNGPDHYLCLFLEI